MTINLTFEEPNKPTAKCYTDIAAVVDAMSHHPGRWVKVRPLPNDGRSWSLSYYRRNYPNVEWVAGRDDSGTPHLYGRWIGE
jgi:hypothetical protein